MSLRKALFRLVRRPSVAELTIDAPDLAVVAEAFDPAEADSAVLSRSHRFEQTRPAVLRHHLQLPVDKIDEARRLVAQDGYAVRAVDSAAGEPPQSSDFALVHVLRVQMLDALHCAQERARMAGLAQRLGGQALGWDALQQLPAEQA